MNAISILFPYKYEGAWVFDDAEVGLHREPFVFGIDKIIDRLVADIPNADKGFKLLFSTTPFPRHSIKLEWSHPDCGGNWYKCPQFNMLGWLCPALYKYYSVAPKEIYIHAETKSVKSE